MTTCTQYSKVISVLFWQDDRSPPGFDSVPFLLQIYNDSKCHSTALKDSEK